MADASAPACMHKQAGAGQEEQIMKEERKTDRQERIPHFRQDVISRAKVLVVGAGATGNEVLKCLALTGFRYVFTVDMDHISTSNLSRTVLFTEKDVGKRKAPLAAERFTGMSIDRGTADYFDGDLCHGLGEGVFRHVDIVIGCLDNEQTRLYVSNICQLLGKPYIDTGIRGFNWNIFVSSGKDGDACYACTLSARGEMRALSRIRNSCDVTRRKAAAEGLVPTIGISAAAAAALAVQEAIKILHRDTSAISISGLYAPRYGYMSLFTAGENQLRNIKISRRKDCGHHDNYASFGGVAETPMSAEWKLRDAFAWVREKYGGDCSVSLFKDSMCTDRGFVTTAFCEHCRKEIEVYKPLPLEDEDMLCGDCSSNNLAPLYPSDADLRKSFSPMDEERLLDMTLLELGIPRLHILAFTPEDDPEKILFLELTGDLDTVMPNLKWRDG